MSGGVISTNPVKGPTTYTGFGATPVITATGSSNGIVWLIQTDTASATLHAYNATNVAQELYNSSQLAARDNPGLPVKFSAPAAANGKVYFGTQASLAVFGVTNVTVAASISISNGPPGNVTINWSGGTLQSASDLQGPWNPVSGTSPLAVPITPGAQYFKVH